jgi:hypothetical protein
MSIVTRHFAPDHTPLPSGANDLRVRFASKRVNNKNTLLLLYPDAEPGFEPSYVRYAVGMKFRQVHPDDGAITSAEGLGQLVVTGQRLLGMITDGTLNRTVLKESDDSVFAFVLDLDDVDPVEIQKNWLGKPVSARLMSNESQSPVFGIQVTGVDLLVKDDGQVSRSSLPALLEQLTPGGRQKLQKKA